MRRAKGTDNVFDTIKYHEFCIIRLEKRLKKLERKVALAGKRQGRKENASILCREMVRALKKVLDEHN